jgi:xylulokinase
MLGEPVMSYEAFGKVVDELSDAPGDVLYYPYLAGSGSPHTNLHVRGALMGLSLSTNQASLVKAVLEGTAYEIELIHRAGEAATGTRLGTITAAGGGTRYPRWMQIKADVSGIRYAVLEMPEATLAGAALLAGIGQGVYSSPAEALGAWRHPVEGIFNPDQERHTVYQAKMDREFLALQSALREFHHHHIAVNKDIHDNHPSFQPLSNSGRN